MFIVVFMLVCTMSNATTKSNQFASKTLNEVILAARNLKHAAIRELSQREDERALVVLREIAAKRVATLEDVGRKYSSVRAEDAEDFRSVLNFRFRKASVVARIALARSGEIHYFEEFIIQLSTSSYLAKIDAMDALAKIENIDAVPHLAAELDTNILPPSEPHVLYLPSSHHAASALGVLLPKVAERLDSNSPLQLYKPVEKWKSWWAEHREEYK